MKFCKRILLGIACLSAALSFTAHADPEAGRDKSFTCTGCHSSPGYRNAYPGYTVPKLGAQKADYLEAALKAYRDGDRQHSTMHAQIAQMSDQDISDIAEYFSQLVKQ
ncbi:MAG: c-type cytochrome [Gammaproteobacteria bacterium]|nr:c-type cytochrome [Gammaproteobacteria bacterium]